MKIVIIYISSHHDNTKKVVEAMAEERKIDLYTVQEAKNIKLTGYDTIGFASGIYYHKFHESIMEFVKENEFNENQQIFTVYTCGINYINYARSIEKIIKTKKSEYIGCYNCRGYDTYSFFEKLGGIAKNHPNNNDLEKARIFIKNI